MPEVLKVFEFADQNRVSQMDIGGGGVEAGLYSERPAGPGRTLEFRAQLLNSDYLFRAFGEISDLLIGCRRANERFRPPG